MSSAEGFDVNALDASTDSAEKLPETVSEVLFEGIKVRIISSRHDRQNTLDEMGLPRALAVETGVLEGENYMDGDIWANSVTNDLPSGQYQRLIDEAQFRQIPIFGIDIPRPASLSESERTEFHENTEKGAYTAFAAAALFIIRRNLDKDARMTRRAFLGGGLAAGASAAYFWSELASALAVNEAPEPLQPAADKIFSALAHLKNSQQFTLRMRNLVMAHKLHSVVEYIKRHNDNLDEIPTITIPVGAGHTEGLKWALSLDPAVREGFISAIFNEAQNITSPAEFKMMQELVTKIPVASVNKKTGAWQGQILGAPFKTNKLR